MVARERASLGILAGGRGTRLGGVDKAFVEHAGVPLLDRVLAAAGAGFGEILVSHNLPAAPRRGFYESRGCRFIGDSLAAGQGPLAGLFALLEAARCEWLLSLPVDLASPSAMVVDALLSTQGAQLRDADGRQPLVALWPVAAARVAVRQALEAGERAAHPLAARLHLAIVELAPLRLGNLNTPADFSTPHE